MDDFVPRSLPQGLAAYENQVAGHDVKDGKSPTGLLKDPDGSILKPLTKDPQRECEIDFYDNVKKGIGTVANLKKFLPEYRGTVTLNINGRGGFPKIKFLKLEDITNGSIKPCIMDIKIGARTWAPDASESKRKAEDSKYADSKKACGFCIPGYKVYNIAMRKSFSFGKESGKQLNAATIPNAFRDFFNCDFGQMSYLIDNYMPTLTDMLEWWKNQQSVHIYSSSLLFFYDAYQLEQLIKANSPKVEVSSWIKLRMIDFAHVVPSESFDSNYIDGLSSLMRLLTQLRLEYI